jgi:TPR repeat protein
MLIMYTPGEVYCLKTGLPDNYEKSFYWLSLAAEQKNMKAQFLLGDLYNLGKGTEKDEFIAYQWYMKSAIQGYPKALTRLHNHDPTVIKKSREDKSFAQLDIGESFSFSI